MILLANEAPQGRFYDRTDFCSFDRSRTRSYSEILLANEAPQGRSYERTDLCSFDIVSNEPYSRSFVFVRFVR